LALLTNYSFDVIPAYAGIHKSASRPVRTGFLLS